MLKKAISYLQNNSTTSTIIIFVIGFISLTASNLINQNLIGDEAVYIVEGDRYLHQPYSFYHNSGSPALLKIITAMPYAFVPLNRNYEPYYNEVFTNVYKVAGFTYVQNKTYAHLIIILARIPHLLISLALGISIFIFTKKYVSLSVAWVALTLYTFHTSFLAHAATANLDIGVTAFTFWALCCFYRYLHSSQHPQRLLILSGIFLGLAQATKISAILLYPFIIGWFFISRGNKKIHNIVTLVAISAFTLWATYLFQIGPILTIEDTPAGIESVYGSIPVLKDYKNEITALLYKPVYPLGAFINNFAFQLSHSFFGHTNYIDGNFVNTGIWYYIPLAFTIKNSIIFVFASLIGLTLLFFTPQENRKLYYYAWSWIILILIWSMQSKLQLGIRYGFPMYPFLFIVAAAGMLFWINYLFKKQYVFPITIAILCLYILSTARVGNDYFTYISEIYRGENPVDIVFDSDYDWGQNVYKVQSFQQSKNMYPLFFRPYIGGDFEFEGIQSEMDPAQALIQKQEGYYAFSHSSLVNSRLSDPTLFSYFYSKRPTYIIGRNIYVYHLSFTSN
jgi:hypothetical protein